MLPESSRLRIEIYEVAGAVPFTDWLDHLPDIQARARIRARIDRLEAGNPGRYEDLSGGLRELKIDWGPGYRVYWAQVGRTALLLLIGGDKRTQTADIKSAREYLAEFSRRSDENQTEQDSGSARPGNQAQRHNSRGPHRRGR